MNKAILLLVLTMVFYPSFAQETKALTEIENFGDNPGNLKMFVYGKPSKKHEKIPLVVVLHGCGQNAKSAAELTGWNKLADLNGFVVLYPQQKLLNNPSLCFNWFNNQDIEKNQGESESIFRMISFMKEKYGIDSNKICITGLSAGAAMSVVMAATHPGLFRSGAIFAGGAYKIAENPMDGVKVMRGNKYISQEKLVQLIRDQNPSYTGKYPSLIVYQGKKDPVADPKNATLLIRQWTGISQADTIPDKIENNFQLIPDITRSEYLDSSGKTAVIYYEVDHLGHQLLVNPGDKLDQGGQTGVFGVDKGFHSTYQTAREFGILKED